jgi:hypothetical protein
MEQQQPVGRFRAHVESILRHDQRQPCGFARPLDGVDLGLASARVHEHEPGQTRPDDEPDDQQPDVEFSVHRRPV